MKKTNEIIGETPGATALFFKNSGLVINFNHVTYAKIGRYADGKPHAISFFFTYGGKLDITDADDILEYLRTL